MLNANKFDAHKSNSIQISWTILLLVFRLLFWLINRVSL